MKGDSPCAISKAMSNPGTRGTTRPTSGSITTRIPLAPMPRRASSGPENEGAASTATPVSPSPGDSAATVTSAAASPPMPSGECVSCRPRFPPPVAPPASPWCVPAAPDFWPAASIATRPCESLPTPGTSPASARVMPRATGTAAPTAVWPGAARRRERPIPAKNIDATIASAAITAPRSLARSVQAANHLCLVADDQPTRLGRGPEESGWTAASGDRSGTPVGRSDSRPVPVAAANRRTRSSSPAGRATRTSSRSMAAASNNGSRALRASMPGGTGTFRSWSSRMWSG